MFCNLQSLPHTLSYLVFMTSYLALWNRLYEFYFIDEETEGQNELPKVTKLQTDGVKI